MRADLLRFYILVFVLLGGVEVSAQGRYKDMMNDNSVNFYEVCRQAENYFQTHDKSIKGSGWKGFQRWRTANEYKYYPSGDRSQSDPFFAEHAFQAFKEMAPEPDQLRLFNNGWNELGPWRIDSITGHYAAGLGRVEDVWVSSSDSNRIYLGSRSGGFWRSLDGGANWEGGSTDFLMASGVNTISVSPTSPDSILINLKNARNGYSHGLYRSVDGGISWTQSNFNPTNVGFGGLGDNFHIYRIAYHPSIPNLIFIGTNEGLYRSDDNLLTWTQIYNSGEFTRIVFHPVDPDKIYVLDTRNSSNLRNYVLRSLDAGLSFSQSNQIAGNNNSSGRLAVSSDCASCLYFASGSGIWKSLDEGMNFTFISNPAVGNSGFTVNDQDSSKMLIGNVETWTSSNSGQFFSQTAWWYLGNASNGSGTLQENFFNSNSYVHADLRIARSVNGVYYIGTDGFLCKSNDNGANWKYLSQGTGVRENYRLGTSQSDHFRTICGSQDNGTSIRVKDLWVEFYGADGMEAVIHPLNYDWMVSSFQYGGRRRTKDGGLTQDGVAPSGQSGSGNADWIAPLAYDSNDQMRLFHFSRTVYRSDDFGSNWVALGGPSTFSNRIKHAAIAENNSDIMVIARYSLIEKSVDGGQTFVSIKNNLPNLTIEDIAFDPNDDDVIVVTYAAWQNDGNKVFITYDGGNNWTNISYNLQDMPIRSAVIDHSDSANIYLGAEIGVFVKSMSDTSWALFNPNLANTTVTELEINYGSNTLKAATWGRGLWEYGLKDRLDFPAILTTVINDLPTDGAPAEGVDQYVTSTISYGNSLSSVYVEWSANTPAFGNVIPMVNLVDSTWESQQPLPNYPAGTKLFFKVFAVGNNNDTTETYKFMYQVQPFEYCAATGLPGTGSDYIDFVEINGVVNTSGQDFYGDFTNVYIDLYKDSTYALQVGLSTAFSPDSAMAWIDFNRNSVFDNDETIVLSAFDASSQAFGSVTIPATVVHGDTVTLRIRNAYNADPEPCGSEYGEVEDYSIVLQDISCTNTYAADTVSACDRYAAPDGQVHTNSGVYTATILNAAGCDSVITLSLSISTLDSTVNLIGNTISSVVAGVSYQWLDCNAGFAPIGGEVNQSFEPLVSGDYAVQISSGLCTDTSVCVTVVIVSLEGLAPSRLMLYPNPTTGQVRLDLGLKAELVSIRVLDASGKEVLQREFRNCKIMDLDLEGAAGIYLFEVEADGVQKVFKVRKD